MEHRGIKPQAGKLPASTPAWQVMLGATGFGLGIVFCSALKATAACQTVKHGMAWLLL